jgi:hypothetical protein
MQRTHQLGSWRSSVATFFFNGGGSSTAGTSRPSNADTQKMELGPGRAHVPTRTEVGDGRAAATVEVAAAPVASTPVQDRPKGVKPLDCEPTQS